MPRERIARGARTGLAALATVFFLGLSTAGAPAALAQEPAADPHAHAGSARDFFQAPEDKASEDPSVPAGSLVVAIADADGAPVPHTDVTLGIVFNSIAKGESRKRVVAVTDASGKARFDGLETGSGVAYRPMVVKDGATFSSTPFQLRGERGMTALLHVYPVTSDVEQTLVVSQGLLYVEVKDDRVQFQESIQIMNFGKTAWVPKDLVLALPPEYTAFATQQGMTDVAAESVPGRGVRIRGTFGPGQHSVDFRWQLPYAGAPEVLAEIGMPPHLAAARVMAPAARSMTLEAERFPAARSTTDAQGQRVLVTETQVRRDDKPMTSLNVAVRGLPSSGSGRWIATTLAAGGLALGVMLSGRRGGRGDRSKERQGMLRELEALERARAAGEIGPKTYERARRDLIDAIAGTLASEAEHAAPTPKRRRTAKAA